MHDVNYQPSLSFQFSTLFIYRMRQESASYQDSPDGVAQLKSVLLLELRCLPARIFPAK